MNSKNEAAANEVNLFVSNSIPPRNLHNFADVEKLR